MDFVFLIRNTIYNYKDINNERKEVKGKEKKKSKEGYNEYDTRTIWYYGDQIQCVALFSPHSYFSNTIQYIFLRVIYTNIL